MKGVLLLAYGTPRSLSEVVEYYTNIRGGRNPSDGEVANLVERYKAIGGLSPLIHITESLRNKLQMKLESNDSDTQVYSAMKHSRPFISDIVADAAKNGVDELLSIALAPHYSRMSVGTYMLAVELANESLPRKMKLDNISSWHAHSIFIKAWADSISRAEKKLGEDYSLVFSAHSLPEVIRKQGDPYVYELLETSELVANAVGRKNWSFAFQSAGHTREPWL
ncbi:MAG: ferrochelatase, partial [Nitrososphaerota archaeon]|nr:ferrochelatase [Nitrososphaerota archaeon]